MKQRIEITSANKAHRHLIGKQYIVDDYFYEPYGHGFYHCLELVKDVYPRIERPTSNIVVFQVHGITNEEIVSHWGGRFKAIKDVFQRKVERDNLEMAILMENCK